MLQAVILGWWVGAMPVSWLLTVAQPVPTPVGVSPQEDAMDPAQPPAVQRSPKGVAYVALTAVGGGLLGSVLTGGVAVVVAALATLVVGVISTPLGCCMLGLGGPLLLVGLEGNLLLGVAHGVTALAAPAAGAALAKGILGTFSAWTFTFWSAWLTSAGVAGVTWTLGLLGSVGLVVAALVMGFLGAQHEANFWFRSSGVGLQRASQDYTWSAALFLAAAAVQPLAMALGAAGGALAGATVAGITAQPAAPEGEDEAVKRPEKARKKVKGNTHHSKKENATPQEGVVVAPALPEEHTVDRAEQDKDDEGATERPPASSTVPRANAPTQAPHKPGPTPPMAPVVETPPAPQEAAPAPAY